MSSEKTPLLPYSDSESSSSSSGISTDYYHETAKDDFPPPGQEVNVILTYDDVLPYIGDIGVWQVTTVILLGVLAADGGILVLLQNFTALEPNSFRCSIDSCDGVNASFEDLQLIPIIQNSSDNESDRFDESLSWTIIEENDIFRNYTNIGNTNTQMCYKPVILQKNDSQFPLPLSERNCSFLTQDVTTGTEKCNFLDPNERLLYEPYEYESTIVTEFKLVCDEQYKIALSGTFYMIGLLIGSFIGGPPADKFGRKPVLFFFLICAGMLLVQLLSLNSF